MSTKNPTQRRHFVIAKDLAAAQPVLDTLLKNGLKPENVAFLKHQWDLYEIPPNQLAFIYVSGYTSHPEWREIRAVVDAMTGLGAIVKPQPTVRLIDQLDADAKAVTEDFASRMDPAVRRLREAEQGLTGGLWDLLGKPVQRNAAGEYEEAPPPEPTHKQVYLGGPKNGQRRRDVKNSARHESFSVPIRDAMFFTDGSAVVLSEPIHVPATYSAWPVSILGQELTFWIYEHDWNERQRLVREYLLSPLEL